MASLEDLLREAAARGITHLSLAPTPSEDGKKTYWQARATPSTEHKYVQCACEDPVEAVAQVLQAMAKAPKRTQAKRFDSVNAPLSEMPQRRQPNPDPNLYGSGVTAAVTATPAGPDVPEPKPETVPEPVPSAPPPINLEEEFNSWLPKP